MADKPRVIPILTASSTIPNSPSLSRSVSLSVSEGSDDSENPDAELGLSSDLTETKQSGRKGKTKTRTGCITCKIRRIKCDETKPFCLRCTQTGRKCDGYLSSTKRKQRKSPITSLNLAEPDSSSPRELTPRVQMSSRSNQIPILPAHPDISTTSLRALSYFQHITSTNPHNFLNTSFWTLQIPQIAYSEPAIRHALVALSATYEVESQHQLLSDHKTGTEAEIDPTVTRKPFACGQYGDAVRELGVLIERRKRGGGEGEEVVVMLASSLFVVLKFMWGYFGEAVVHLHSEVEILEDWKQRRKLNDSSRPAIEGSLENNIVNLIVGQSFGSEALGNLRDKACERSIGCLKFNDVDEAEKILVLLFRESLRLIRLHGVLSQKTQHTRAWDQFNNNLGNLKAQLQEWYARLQLFMALNEENASLEDRQSIAETKVLYFAAQIWLYAGMAPLDELPPEPKELFHEFLDHFEMVKGQFGDGANFKIEDKSMLCAGAVPALHYIRTKSASNVLRRRAVGILNWGRSIRRSSQI